MTAIESSWGMGFGGLAARAGEVGRPHPRCSLGPATSRGGSGPEKNFRLPRNPIIVWPMTVHQKFSPQAEGGRGSRPGNSVPKTDPSGVWGAETPGCSASTHSGSKTSEKKVAWGLGGVTTVGWIRRGPLGISLPETGRRVVAFPALPVRSTAMWLKGLMVLGGGGRGGGGVMVFVSPLGLI